MKYLWLFSLLMQCCSSFTFPRRFGKNQPLSCTATTNEDIEAYNSLKTQVTNWGIVYYFYKYCEHLYFDLCS